MEIIDFNDFLLFKTFDESISQLTLEELRPGCSS